jgi:hypothetical protein
MLKVHRLAKQAGPAQAFEAIGKTSTGFSDMYRLALPEVLTIVASLKI